MHTNKTWNLWMNNSRLLLNVLLSNGAVTKQPLKSKKLLVDYMKSANNFFCISKQKGSRGTLFVGIIKL